MKTWSLIHSSTRLVPVALGLALAAPVAHGQEAMIEVGPSAPTLAEIAPADAVRDDESPCGPLDPDCRRRLLSLLAGNLNVLQPRVDAGVRFGHGAADAAVRFQVSLADIDAMIGDISVLPFEAIYLHERGGFRLRFTLADAEVLFLCNDFDSGKYKAPLLGWLQYDCRPDEVIGIGGKITEIQWDQETGRVAARWLELQAVANLLANGNSFDYLRRRLVAFAGASFETVWPGSTPGAPDVDADVIGRLKFGVMGMIRSENNRFEARGYAAYRPSVTSFSDFAIEAKTEFLYHLLFSDQIVASVGLDGRYSYWGEPSHSIGAFTSDRDRHSAYVGALFRMTFGNLGVPLSR